MDGFVESLARTFAPRSELRRRLRPETVVCRCEDVRWGDLDTGWSSRQAKLYTRLGMGEKIDRPDDAGGYPEMKTGRPPADTDLDGMPDDWETSHGFDPRDPEDGHGDADRDGYDSADHGGDDCNDAEPLVNPARGEVWYDGLDGDCDGAIDEDYSPLATVLTCEAGHKLTEFKEDEINLETAFMRLTKGMTA